MSPQKKIVLFLISISVLVLLIFLLPVTEWLVAVLHWIERNREVSWVIFILLYIFATVFLIPGSILTLGAGFLFNLPVGVVLVSLSSVTGASLSFVIGRFFARDWITEKSRGMKKFNALDRAISEQGILIVFLTRLSPVFPFNLLNYALGLTGVKFTHYVLASWVGMLPGTVMYVYLGTAAKNLTALVSGNIETGQSTNILLYIGLVATIVLTVVITRIATRALKSHLSSEEPDLN